MNIFLNKTWQQRHLKDIKQKAGKRYTPHLNVNLPIAEIFEGISRTYKFYNEIQKHYGNLKREFRYISNLSDRKFQSLYKEINKRLHVIFGILAKIEEYNTTKIPWDKLNKKMQKVEKLVFNLIEELQKFKLKENDKKDFLREKIEGNIYYLSKLRKELDYFIEVASSTKGKLSNHPFLLLTGEAGIGKTHLLCDIVEHRVKDGLPAVLVFGEFFKKGIDVWQQIIGQLKLLSRINSKENFLNLLDTAGSISKCRALLIIDALNESVPPSFWRRNLKKVVREIKKYKNIALIVSIRSGFEHEVITEEAKEEFIEEKHRGFSFREWEAVTKFFKEFSLPLPEVPLLLPEFQNPLFLLLFCRAFQKGKKREEKGKEVFRGHEGFTYIFENFVDNVAKDIENKFGISHTPKKNIWDNIIEKIAKEMVNHNTDRISQGKLFEIINSAYLSIDVNEFIKELDRNLLVVRVPRYSKELKIEGYDYKFPFNKFSDHLIVRYLLKKCKSENRKPEDFFKENTKIANMLKWNYGLVEALSIQCPEWFKGKEIFEVAPYLKDPYFINDAFLKSIIWRKPKAFSKRTINKISNFLRNKVLKLVLEENEKYEDYFIYPQIVYKLLDALLSITSVPEHPLNAKFLHNHLNRFSMPERDAWWSAFLHFQHGQRESVERIIEWSWSDYDKSYIKDNSIFLISTTLAWFLTTPNRFIRDKSTKALVSLLQYRLHLIPKLLEKFKDINDIYVLERLFAVAYACVLRNQDDLENIKEIAKWTYDNIFKSGKPPLHILLRDYARGTIEVALGKDRDLKFDNAKINPPYKSNWPKHSPSDNEIKNYKFDYESKDFKKYFWSQNSIIYSMQPEYSTIGTGMYGDFGRYVFQSALQRWDTKKVSIQQLSNLAAKMVFKELGYNVELHGRFDRYFNRGRDAHKPERIGKKYQWIAFHKILALVSDKFPLKKNFGDKEYKEYIGPWEPHIRDLDPTFLIKNDEHLKESLSINKWKVKIQKYNAWNVERTTSKWLKTKKDLPDPKYIIQIKDDKNQEWIVLEGFIKWEEKTPPEYEKYEIRVRELWYWVKSYIVKKEDLDKIFKWSKKQNFWGKWMPESYEFYEAFLGEYPNSVAFEDLRKDCNVWVNEILRGNQSLPAPVIVTDDIYLNEFIYDCTHDGAISIKLPCKWLVNKLKIKQKHVDGRWFNKKDELVCLPTTIFEEEPYSALVIRKNFLVEFLRKNDYGMFWTVLGEKRLIGGNINQNYLGHLIINGAYKINRNGNLEGNFTTKFER